MRSPTALALLALTVLAAASACGGESKPGTDAYNAYRQLEDARNDAESDLRQAFADVSERAAGQNREGVLEAARTGLDAVTAIDAALVAEIDAAKELQQVEALAADGRALEEGLIQSRQGLDLVRRELEIALADPFLEREENKTEIGRLTKQSTDLAVKGELAVRKADRKLALALGIDPRRDQALDNPTTTG